MFDGQEVSDVEELLKTARPLPSPSFRGALARLVVATPLPRAVSQWRAKAVALTVGGILLLALAGAGVAGHGPLAPSHEAAAAASSVHAAR